MNVVEINKAWSLAKTIVDELEMRNYLELLKQSNREGLISKDEYHKKLVDYMKLYEKR